MRHVEFRRCIPRPSQRSAAVAVLGLVLVRVDEVKPPFVSILIEEVDHQLSQERALFGILRNKADPSEVWLAGYVLRYDGAH